VRPFRFFLLDALAERLAFVRQVGEYFEWEGTLAHDVSRFTHAIAAAKAAAADGGSSAAPQPESPLGHGPNVYRFWLEAENAPHSADSLARFLKLAADESERRRACIVAVQNGDVDFFDVNHFLQTVKVVHQEYDVNVSMP
jgi:hypothetical protein